MNARLQPYFAKLISSHWVRGMRRRIADIQSRSKGHFGCLTVYINPRDPHSYLLLQVLGDLKQRFSLSFRFVTVFNLQDDMFPEAQLWHAWAKRDAADLARLYQLRFAPAEGSPAPAQLESALVILLKAEKNQEQEDYIARALTCLRELWASPHPALPAAQLSASDKTRIAQNEALLRGAGHYLGSVIHWAPECYWGVDRLDHLENRLIASGLSIGQQTAFYTRTYAKFCTMGPRGCGRKAGLPLTVFFSIRSPYSHIGLERAVALANYYKVPLDIKPVMPMLMRGKPVPDAKKWYIFLDTKREAEKLGIDYGFVADPLGEGVLRCYALYPYAQAEGKGVEYLLSYARAVNAKGIRSETDAGLKRILEEAGLDWQIAQTHLKDTRYLQWTEQNLQEMYALGLWGVPSFQYGAVSCWGQDRLWLIEDAITQAANQGG